MKFLNLLPLALALTVLTACSQNGSVSLKGLDVTTTQAGNDTYVNMDAVLATGNLKFPNIEIPIINPTNLQVYGQMALQNLPDGTNKLFVSVDYNEISKLDPGAGSILPNGRELPASMKIPTTTTMIGIPVLDHSRIYLGGDLQKDFYMGAAITIPAFDAALNNVPVPLNIFFGFPFSAQVTGFAGLFTGPATGQNGIAVFVKKSVVAATPNLKSHIMTTVAIAPVQPTGGEEMGKLSNLSLLKLDRLFKKNAVLKIK